MRFYLGIHQPHWLAAVPPDVRLFVSRTRLCERLRPRARLPVAAGPWSLDSGGFTELSRKGEWTVDAPTYAAEVRRYAAEVGQLEWAAPQDWMCEPEIIAGDAARGYAGTGLSVPEHQRRTVSNFLTLREELGEIVIPVLQGWTRDEYLRCVDLYAEAGVALDREARVGVGSVCRRQGTSEAAGIFAALAALGLRLHGFGVKANGLELFADDLSSSDSMAWSYAARRDGTRRRKLAERLDLAPDHSLRFGACGKRTCANCLHRALEWRAALLGQLDLADHQLRLEVPV